MSGKSSLFSVLKKLFNGTITLGDKGKCNIIGVGKIGNNISNLINDVYLVDGLKFNLLSISQLCDKGNKVTFDKENVKFVRSKLEIFCLLHLDVIIFMSCILTKL